MQTFSLTEKGTIKEFEDEAIDMGITNHFSFPYGFPSITQIIHLPARFYDPGVFPNNAVTTFAINQGSENFTKDALWNDELFGYEDYMYVSQKFATFFAMATHISNGAPPDNKQAMLRNLLCEASEYNGRDLRKLWEHDKKTLFSRAFERMKKRYEHDENIYACMFNILGGYNSHAKDIPLWRRLGTAGKAKNIMISIERHVGRFSGNKTLPYKFADAVKKVDDYMGGENPFGKERYAICMIALAFKYRSLIKNIASNGNAADQSNTLFMKLDKDAFDAGMEALKQKLAKRRAK